MLRITHSNTKSNADCFSVTLTHTDVKDFRWNIIRMEILIHQQQRVEYGEQCDTTCLVPQYTCYGARSSDFFHEGLQQNDQELRPHPLFFKIKFETNFGETWIKIRKLSLRKCIWNEIWSIKFIHTTPPVSETQIWLSRRHLNSFDETRRYNDGHLKADDTHLKWHDEARYPINSWRGIIVPLSYLCC